MGISVRTWVYCRLVSMCGFVCCRSVSVLVYGNMAICENMRACAFFCENMWVCANEDVRGEKAD